MSPQLLRLLGRLRFAPQVKRLQQRGGFGQHRAQGLGRSHDFREYRPYQPGDDLRDLDWRVYARTDRLTTRLYTPELDQTVLLCLDRSASMSTKWHQATRIAIGLATVAVRQGDRVGLHLLSTAAAPESGVSPARGKTALHRIHRQLQRVEPSGRCRIEESLESLRSRLKAQAHLLVLSDFLQPGGGLPGLRRLAQARHRLSALQLLAPEELEPETAMGPGEWELFDLEAGQDSPEKVRLDLGPQDFQRYRAALSDHRQRLTQGVRSVGGSFAWHSTGVPLKTLFGDILPRSGILTFR